MHSSWILVVDDDEDLREHVLVSGLKAKGFKHVRSASNAFEAYRTMLTQTFSLFVLDVGLPDENGLEVAKHVRSTGDAGIVMLTGWRKSAIDQVEGLDNGADAYLTKPVDIDLLAATVRSVLRRKEALNPKGDASREPAWALSPDGWFLLPPGGAQVPLTRIERAFMQLLFANFGRVVDRDAIVAILAQEASGESADFDPHRVELMVHRLRKKIAKLAGRPLPLSTIRGTGYAVTAR